MFERFTERARKVVVLAQDEASRYDHPQIGTEHLLAGLIREEEGIGARVLDSQGLTLERTRRWIDELVGRGLHTSGPTPFMPLAKKVMEMALREALQLGHNYVGTEHILLGLMRVEEGIGYQILSGHKIEADVARREVIRHLGGGFAHSAGGRTRPRPPRGVAKAMKSPQREQVKMYGPLEVGPLHTSLRKHGKHLVCGLMWRKSRYASIHLRLPSLKVDKSRWNPATPNVARLGQNRDVA